MKKIEMTHEQARRFLLLKAGLLGEYKFIGKQGALDFVRQASCIQFDPVDVCGKNAELTLQSRVKHFTKRMLQELLYRDRLLVDYPDKNLSIIPVEDWPYFERYRAASRQNGLQFSALKPLEQQAIAYISENGPVSAEELPISGNIRWHSAIHWSGAWDGTTNAARAVLEQLYAAGALVIHHKQGARKYYDLSEKHIPGKLLHAADPLPDEFEHQKWRILRRIGAVGLLWNRSSDAWLNIWGLQSPQRQEAFRRLIEEEKITEIKIETFKDSFYCRTEDLPLIETALQNDKLKARCELIAPLDCLLWDRKLIRQLFGFDYTWEIYTPPAKRKYGFYVLPVLYGDRFIGRAEAAADRKTRLLTIKNIWTESGIKQTRKLRKAVEGCLNRARFNECDVVSMPCRNDIRRIHDRQRR
ncbi:MAG: winged helix-turn-helix domain-containing protein [Faecalispora jeddahensis]